MTQFAEILDRLSSGLEAAFGNVPGGCYLPCILVSFFLLRLFVDFLRKRGHFEVTGKVSKVKGNGVVQIDVGSDQKVAPGQVFTLYKRLALREVWQERDGCRKVVYTPIGRMKVISTTRNTALCKFRPIDGYSYSPGPGDTVHYSSKLPLGKIIPLPSA